MDSQFFSILAELLAKLCEMYPPRRSGKQDVSQFCFQILDLQGQGRLREKEIFRRL